MRAALLLSTALSLVCTWAQADVQVTDGSGALVRLAAPARRIVSLAPHMTEVLFEVGAGDKVVGAVEYSDYPEAAKKVRRVGGYSRVDLEAVAALRPDLIVAWQSGNSPSDVEKLKGLGFPVYLSQPNLIAGIPDELERIGKLAGTDVAAKAAANRFRDRYAKLTAHYGNRPPIGVFYQIWKQPLMTVNGKQIISDALRICGGRNVFANLPNLAPTVTVEAVIAANPEVIMASGMGDSRPEWLDDWRRWPSLTAVARNNLYFVPPEEIQRHTSRILDGTEKLCLDLDAARAKRK
ncbi:MAG TPA: cobalamin-binding protein [Rhodocyclaceae bacterium]|nr:cobalamin-binding protein [Rhodocyclaceae bacterium]